MLCVLKAGERFADGKWKEVVSFVASPCLSSSLEWGEFVFLVQQRVYSSHELCQADASTTGMSAWPRETCCVFSQLQREGFSLPHSCRSEIVTGLYLI